MRFSLIPSTDIDTFYLADTQVHYLYQILTSAQCSLNPTDLFWKLRVTPLLLMATVFAEFGLFGGVRVVEVVSK